MSLTRILSRTPVRSIEEAIAIMSAIDGTLPDTDGVKWFNRLYLRVTVIVGRAAAGATFEDPAFLTKLYELFGSQYFAALAAAPRGPSAVPSAWPPLLESRHSAGIARIQCALAGMNAH